MLIVTFPDTALKASICTLFQEVTNATGAVSFYWFEPNNYYQFEITASRNGISDNRESEYTATGYNILEQQH